MTGGVTSSAKVPKEDQDGVDMMPLGNTLAEGRYLGSAAGLDAPDRAGEAQVAQEGAPHQRGEAQRAALLEQAEEALVAREKPASQPRLRYAMGGLIKRREGPLVPTRMWPTVRRISMSSHRGERQKKKRRLLNKPG